MRHCEVEGSGSMLEDATTEMKMSEMRAVRELVRGTAGFHGACHAGARP